jgi:hypothetical protein
MKEYTELMPPSIANRPKIPNLNSKIIIVILIKEICFIFCNNFRWIVIEYFGLVKATVRIRFHIMICYRKVQLLLTEKNINN